MLRVLRPVAWLGTGVIAFLLLTQPVSAQVQLSLGVTIILAMAFVWRFGRGAVGRHLFLALGSFVVVRYMYWRITSTLPPFSDPLGLTLGIILLLAEIYCVLILTISLIINVEPLKRAPLERAADDEVLPTVDVFIPSYNEEAYILATTIAAAKSMDYPSHKLNVWLLDDGGTDQKCSDRNPDKAEAALRRRATLQALCADLGAIYHTRARNEHAKAGNMNDALRFARASIVVVFDADHAPFRAFLRETVGYFAKDPKLFLVQTPHVFLNPDPVEKNLRTFERMPSENEMFYSVTQRGLDKWNGSFFCGSAALLRRSALDATGGFSGITITEDCETAFELHSKGWTSVYVDKPLIAGLQPETFSSFIGQRSRWCQGMFQILLLKNPALKKGLKPIQKLAYLSSMTFWFFPFPRLVFMFAPLTHIFFNVKIFVSNVNEAIAYTGTYIIVNMMLQNYLYGSVRWPWVSELYEYLQGVFLAKAIVAVIAKPRKPTFNVTAKGLTLDKDHLSELAWPFFIIWGLLLLGAFAAAWRYFFEPGVSNLMLVVGLWNGFNLLIAGAALGAVAERKQPDRHPFLPIHRKGVLSIGERSVAVDIVSVSAGGCAVRPECELPVGAFDESESEARLFIEPVGAQVGEDSLPILFGRARATPDGFLHGLEFGEMRSREYYVLADLMYGDSDALPRFLARRRKHKGLLTGSLQFMLWGVVEPLRAAVYAIRRSRPQEQEPAPGFSPIPQSPSVWLSKVVSVANARDAARASAASGKKAA
ncbi:MAG TPA: UDP-forming cellulose synthase catalytic subunit [Beijerinckiaceae bacterium]|nr:UDP-forming cellulose synthase catalytic subunit [Beijerinckiaceae bacterium]